MKFRVKPFYCLFIVVLFLSLTANCFGFRGHGGQNVNGNSPGMFINQLPQEELSEDEKGALIKMREEEKLARDVYVYLYEMYEVPVFNNISRSEQRHMDAIASLLNKYGINDPVAGLDYGEFASEEMQELYAVLTSKGATDLASAYNVGATIEDLDIKDLQDLLEKVDNRDIKFVFQNLMKGSRNHLRAFTTMLKNSGLSYAAQYLTQEEIDEIINSSWERGPVDENGHAISFGGGKGRGCSSCGNRGRGRNFVDNNGDGICDNMQ